MALTNKTVYLITGIFFILLAIVIIIHPISAAKNGISLTVSCSNGASLLVHNQESWATGSDLSKLQDQAYTGGAAGHRVITNYGSVNYALDAEADATEANSFQKTSYARSSAMMITDDSLSMDNSAPNQTDLSCTAGDIGAAKSGTFAGNVANKQWGEMSQSSMGQGMEVKASKHVDDTNINPVRKSRLEWNRRLQRI